MPSSADMVLTMTNKHQQIYLTRENRVTERSNSRFLRDHQVARRMDLYSHRQKKLDSSLNRHTMKSIKDRIDLMIGSKAEIQ